MLIKVSRQFLIESKPRVIKRLNTLRQAGSQTDRQTELPSINYVGLPKSKLVKRWRPDEDIQNRELCMFLKCGDPLENISSEKYSSHPSSQFLSQQIETITETCTDQTT